MKNIDRRENYCSLKKLNFGKCVILKGKKFVGCVFSVNYHVDGTIERYKVRLVAKTYTKTYRVDYSKTFSLIAKIDMIRVLFLVVANKD